MASAKKAAPAAPTRLSEILIARPAIGERYDVTRWRRPEDGASVDTPSQRVSSPPGASGSARVTCCHDYAARTRRSTSASRLNRPEPRSATTSAKTPSARFSW